MRIGAEDESDQGHSYVASTHGMSLSCSGFLQGLRRECSRTEVSESGVCHLHYLLRAILLGYLCLGRSSCFRYFLGTVGSNLTESFSVFSGRWFRHVWALLSQYEVHSNKR